MTSSFSPGDIVDFFVPYQNPKDGKLGKFRPALIVQIENNTAIALALKITKSGPNPQFPHRYPIRHWQFANLDYPSYCQVNLKATLHLNNHGAYKYRGTLWPSDFSYILKKYAPFATAT